MAETDGPVEPVEPVEVVDDGAEAEAAGGVERSFVPLPAPDVAVGPDAEAAGSAREQAEQSQQ